MDIDKYIENTKRKTKKAKLPALSTLTPVLPDAGAGIETFNSMSGASLSEDLSSDIESEIRKECIDFMLDKNFEKNDIDNVLSFDFKEHNGILSVDIRADLTVSSLRELADTLYPIIDKYDEDAYFDISTKGISADIEMYTKLTESLTTEQDIIDLFNKIYNEHEQLFINLSNK